MVPLGNQVTDQLHQLGISPEIIEARLGRLQRAPVNALSHLSAAYAQAAAGSSATQFGTDISDDRVGMAPAWSNLAPSEALQSRARYVFKTYHRPRVLRHPTATGMPGLEGRQRQGTMMVRRLHRDPVLRQAFERATALEVVRDGRMDGTVSVAAMTSTGGSTAASTAGYVPTTMYDFLGAMDTAILEQAQKLGVYASSDPEVFFGEGRDLDLFGKGSQYGVPSPSTTGVFGFGSGATGLGGTGLDGTGPQTPEGGDQSMGLDTRVMQLKRMMDKRSQMYDIVRTVFDKSNEAARTAINNLKA